MTQIFISYSSVDRPFAMQTADKLAKFYTVWIDQEGIDGGSEWEAAIDAAIHACKLFIVIVSPESNASDWVTRETLRAEQLGKYRIPLLLRGELPLRLLNLQYIDFLGDVEGGYRDLMEVLGKKLEPEADAEDAIVPLLGRAVLARLAHDFVNARNLIEQALVINPDLTASADALWAQLAVTDREQLAQAFQKEVLQVTKSIVKQTVRQLDKSQYPDRPTFQWWLWLDVPAAWLQQIEYVRYELHETFPKPQQIVRDRATNFQLQITGWGTFEIFVELHFIDGSQSYTRHMLRFPQ